MDRSRSRRHPTMRKRPGRLITQAHSGLESILIDIGRLSPAFPVTPPDMRVRIRRFGGLGYRPNSQSRNPERVEIGIGQCEMEPRRVRQPPRTASASRRFGGENLAHAPFPQFSKPHRSPLPLRPDRRPKPAPEPLLKVGQHRRRLTLPEVADPAPQIPGPFFGHPFRTHAARPSRQFPNPLGESKPRLRRDPPLGFSIRRETESPEISAPKVVPPHSSAGSPEA